MKILFTLTTCISLTCFIYSSLSAQILVTGSVADEITMENLVGVTVIIEGTLQGTFTDTDGNFSITVPSEETKLVFSYVGYLAETIPIGNKRVINVALAPDISRLSEIIVSAQAIGQKRAINQQINSVTIKNVVAPDRLQENPDANAVEAIGRLPGIFVLRSGGEGTGLVIRGLEPKYSAVTLNGIAMPFTSGTSRETNISGISQYILQGVEVYKALTPDMEANSVAGSVNLMLREIPQGLHYRIMTQGGYNNQNSYFGNYKLQGELSNRVFKEKLGVFFSVNAERVNRSTQTMSSGYTLGTSTELNILNNGFSLNNIHTIKERRSSMLSLDYKVHPSTLISLYGLYSYTHDNHNRQSKNFDVNNSNANYQFHDNPFHNGHMFQSTLSGKTIAGFLKMELNYGVSYSQNKANDPDSRSWFFEYTPRLLTNSITFEQRELPPHELIKLFDHTTANDKQLYLKSFDWRQSDLSDLNLTSYMNIDMPYELGNLVNGKIKFGGMYRVKQRYYNVLSGNQPILVNKPGRDKLADELQWIYRDGISEDITAEGMQDQRLVGFLNGQYDFGYTYDFDKLNQITSHWISMSDYYYSQGPGVWSAIFGARDRFGFRQDIQGSMMDDQDIVEKYSAGYLMSEINLGQWVMFLPGVRYEHTSAEMHGFHALNRQMPEPIQEPLMGDSTFATRSDNFLLPMMHLRIKPIRNFFVHFAYTQSLSRPDFHAISPNQFITNFSPFSYTAQNSELKAEHWENYDANFTLHGNKTGLISISLFRKNVQNKIWHRGFTRLRGDMIYGDDYFSDDDQVHVSVWENHPYNIELRGLEFEVQTSFWYLPKPFNYFTVSANYTYTDSETHYPLSWIETHTVYPPGGGRPTVRVERIDSTVVAPMLFQPKHILNASLGFNREGLNVWASFQYNGDILTGKDYKNEAMDSMKEHFYRMDLQISQKLTGRFKNFELVGNFANLTNFSERSRLRGEAHHTYLENYGWTIDLGLRFGIK
jgi:TonB-dependent receptor